MILRFATCLSILFIYSSSLFASIPFLKEVTSPFPSGLSSKEELSTKLVDSFSELYFYTKDSELGEFWIKEDEVISWKQLATELVCTKKAPLYIGRNPKVEPKHFCSKGEELSVLGYQNKRFRVRNDKSRIYWIPSDYVEWKTGSLGKTILKRDTYLVDLKKGGKIWLKAPVTLALLRYHKNDLFVDFGGEIFRAPRNKFVTPLDIASDIQFKSGKHYPFLVKNNKLSAHGKSFKIPSKPLLVFNSHFFYLKPDSSMYHFSGKQFLHSRKAKQYRKLFSLRSKEEIWYQSHLKRHGMVYWRDYKHIAASEILSDDLFFEREVYDMASSPLDRKIIFASAEGVFRKISENQWEPLADFQNKNYPIHFANRGRLFVGPYFSDDHGKHFKAYVPWPKVMNLLKKHSALIVNKAKITKVSSLDSKGESIKIRFSDGKMDFNLKYSFKNKKWKAEKF